MKASERHDYFQPLIELLHSAETFGSDFDCASKRSHFVETLHNVHSLLERTQRVQRTLSGIAGCYERETNKPYPGVLSDINFLTELADDLFEIERRMTDRELTSKAA